MSEDKSSFPAAESSLVFDSGDACDSDDEEMVSALSELNAAQLARIYWQLRRAATSSPVNGLESVEAPESEVGDEGQRCEEIMSERLRGRDRELELAARVGQELLARNASLTSDLTQTATERERLEQESAQLRHEISMKDHLLELYMRELDEAQMISPAMSIGSLSSDDINLPPDPDELQTVHELNVKLAQEAAFARQQAEELARREQELINTCVEQIDNANKELVELRSNTKAREIAAARHEEELAELRARNAQLEEAHDQLSEEKRRMQESLERTSVRQNSLADQITTLQSQYGECLALFRQATHELAVYRKYAVVPWQLADITVPEDGEAASEARCNLQASQRSLGDELKAAQLKAEPQPITSHGFCATDEEEQRKSTVCQEGSSKQPVDHPSVDKSRKESSSGKSRVSQVRLGQVKLLTDTIQKMEKARLEQQQAPPDNSPVVAARLKNFSAEEKGVASRQAVLPQMSPPVMRVNERVVEKVESIRPSYKPASSKVQIVKPMQGSMTLLKWHLLAMQNGSGRPLMTSAEELPGVHVKGQQDSTSPVSAAERRGKVRSCFLPNASQKTVSSRVVGRSSRSIGLASAKSGGLGLGALLDSSSGSR